MHSAPPVKPVDVSYGTMLPSCYLVRLRAVIQAKTAHVPSLLGPEATMSESKEDDRDSLLDGPCCFTQLLQTKRHLVSDRENACCVR